MKNILYTLFAAALFFLNSCGGKIPFFPCDKPKEYKGRSQVSIILESMEIVKRPSEKKAVAFCIFGDNPSYTEGVLTNIEMAKELYPGWDVVIFFDSATVSQEIIKEAAARGAKVYADPKYKNAAARFFVADLEYDRFVSRDADSRISRREIAAVADWMKNDWATLHGMRDTGAHLDPLMAGMWGAQVKGLRASLQKAYNESSVEKLYDKFIEGKSSDHFGEDQKFLAEIVLKAVGYEAFLSHERVYCNAFPHSRGYPIPISPMKIPMVGDKILLPEPRPPRD